MKWGFLQMGKLRLRKAKSQVESALWLWISVTGMCFQLLQVNPVGGEG